MSLKESLKEKIILVTGAGGGLGSVAAQALAEQGAQVILLDKLIPALEKTYDAIAAAGAVEPIMYPFDLNGANEQDYLDLAERIAAEYGRLHGLLHSAVAFKAFTPMSSISTKDWAHSLNVNLNAPFLLTRVLLPLLTSSEEASVVFTLDSAVSHTRAYAGAYGVAKIALQGFAGILSEELAADGKVRVNCLIPGPVDSPLRQKAYPGEDKTRLPTLASMAPVYPYLFSAASLGVNGQTVDARTFHL